jgi:hypothetical protein
VPPSVTGKVDKLIAAAAALLKPPDDPWQRAQERYRAAVAGALETLEPLGLPDELHDTVCDLIVHNGELILYGIVGAPVTSLIGWPQALADLLAVTPPDLRPRVVTAADRRKRPDGAEHPVADWIHNLTFNRGRLPDGLAPDTVRPLLAVCLDRRAEVDECSCCCESCGLQRPHRRWRPTFDGTDGRPPPDFFDACPHCQDARWTWTHLSERSPAVAGQPQP